MFQYLAKLANISFTDFIRTSEPRHHAAVEHFWVGQGFLFLSEPPADETQEQTSRVR